MGIPGIERGLENFKMCTHTELLVPAITDLLPKFLDFWKKRAMMIIMAPNGIETKTSPYVRIVRAVYTQA